MEICMDKVGLEIKVRMDDVELNLDKNELKGLENDLTDFCVDHDIEEPEKSVDVLFEILADNGILIE